MLIFIFLFIEICPQCPLLKETSQLLRQCTAAMSGGDAPSITQQYKQYLQDEENEQNPRMQKKIEEQDATHVQKIQPSHHRRMASFLKQYYYDDSHANIDGEFDEGLRLHRHHWRLSLVRCAFLLTSWHYTFEASAQKKASQKTTGQSDGATASGVEGDIDFSSFDYVSPGCPFSISVLLDQMATETLFIPIGHPHALRSYRWFRRLTRGLKSDDVADLQRSASKILSADNSYFQWDLLNALDAVFLDAAV